MSDCIFCKIIAGEIKTPLCYENDAIIAFDDINPQAPTHKLIVPKKHIETLNNLSEHDSNVIGRMVTAAQAISTELGHNEGGYRIVMNCNADGGQTVNHIHMHFLAGRQMKWPPG